MPHFLLESNRKKEDDGSNVRDVTPERHCELLRTSLRLRCHLTIGEHYT
jgi:hypothetical protein